MQDNGSGAAQDMWARWLLYRRFGGDESRMQKTLTDTLYPIRDRLLDGAELREGDTVLDVGCGDGLIAFGVVERLQSGTVIFSDISQDLLDHSSDVATKAGVADRCRFVSASADDLSPIADESVNVVTTRSVLIYVSDKLRAFREFFRVLAPGGRIAVFEPINRFSWPESPNRFLGYDVTPVIDIAEKVRRLYREIQPPETDPMTDFDEGDLLSIAEDSGFVDIRLDLRKEIKSSGGTGDWVVFLRTAGNPKIPTLEEALDATLTSQEAERFRDYLRPLEEAKKGVRPSASAYLWASKGEARATEEHETT